jgi:hypothetical protein
MIKWPTSKKDASNLRVLDKITALITVRGCLDSLRRNRNRDAIRNLELFLDTLVSSLAEDSKRCDATTKAMMAEEFRKTLLYRTANAEDVGHQVASTDEPTLKSIRKRRGEVEAILEECSQVRPWWIK